LRKQGPIQTYRAVMKKLDAYSHLGYSSAGEVVEVGEDVTEFEVGDLVACAGAGYANHAEIITVPKNLCVKLSENSNLKNAAYNTLGAISLQGFRQLINYKSFLFIYKYKIFYKIKKYIRKINKISDRSHNTHQTKCSRS
jgi:threonine dehydrogenase-like Zn-dependent dehydrogenase